MDPWAGVRLRARSCHAQALNAAGGDRSASALVAAAVRLRAIDIVPFAPGTRFGPGVRGVYERVGPIIHVDATLASGQRAVVIAHEIAHHELDHGSVEAMTDAHPAAGTAARIVGYSPLERREIAADIFASEFLVPADWLRGELIDRARRPSDGARDLGLPAQFVAKQAVRAVCLPPLRAAPRWARGPLPLDPAQSEAATWDRGPLVVQAGPGTGKTATLVGRIEHLLSRRETRILVLTFSCRAAAELRTRIAEIAPGAADAIWIGTVHGFGLEVVHAFHYRIGRGPRPRLLDMDGALDLIERNLEALTPSLRRDLRDPVADLAPILRVIGRCKDEMVTPGGYAAAVEGVAVDGDDAAIAASRDVAAVYDAYERLLEAEDALDFGDLVALSARLLQDREVARHYGARFAEVLVDEAQDFNAASMRLLQGLCDAGARLWAVGDGRQSIYRFRGARPDAITAFPDDFGGATLALDRTYRGTPEIVSAFSTFAASAIPGGAIALTSERPPGAPVRRLVAATLPGEIAALAGRIEDLRSTGVGYGDQAVLARTHRTLEAIGAGLERHGIRIQYLGDLLVRDDVRDWLALLSIDAEPVGLGLLRLATRPPYDVPRSDVVATIRWATTAGLSIDNALGDPRHIPGIDVAAAAGLARLGRDLAAAGPRATAWTVLVTWLFETHAASSLVDDAASPMRRIAAYQILRLAAEEATGRGAFLSRIRRAAALGGGREHGAVAPEAEAEDAVRLMTVHAAKGLEFAAVHLPMASSRHLPLPHRQDAYPPPPDLARLAVSPEEHDAEEKALWFVALSRARDHLTISHAKRYGDGRDVRPSRYLAQVGRMADTWSSDAGLPEPPSICVPQAPRSAYPARDLDGYLRCPARYRYEVVDGFAQVMPASGRRRMMRAVRGAMRRVEDLADHGAMPTYEDGAAALSATWANQGPVGEPREAAYRAVAEHLVGRLVETIATEIDAVHHRGEWAVDVEAGLVLVGAHRVVQHPWGAVTVQVFGARRRAAPADIPAILAIAVRMAFPQARVTIEMIDPDDGDMVEVALIDEAAALARYRGAIAAIERGAFQPRPDQRVCPTCPFFFVCGA